MTKQLFKVLSAAAVVAVLAVAAVPAEAADIRCRIPFDFTVAGKTMTAGTYIVSNADHMLSVRGQTDGAFVQTISLGARDNRPRLVFEKYGDTYVLRQAWTGSAGRELTRTKRDRELARLARGGQVAAVERVVIPAL